MAKLETTACPGCATVGSLSIEKVLHAAPVGSYSLAGVMVKFPARVRPQLVCGKCPYRLVGEFDGHHVVFDPAQAGQ
jgi:hypothetical protein